jgi:hypothetical protein
MIATHGASGTTRPMARAQLMREFATFTGRLVELRDWLVGLGCDPDGDGGDRGLWKPVWHVLEEADFELLLVGPAHFKNVPGRKTT